MTTCDKTKFLEGLNSVPVLKQLADDEDTVNFYTHFEKTYAR